MKKNLWILLALTALAIPGLAMQGRGGRGGAAPAGTIPPNPGFQGSTHRPSDPGPASNASDHLPDASSHAVDPTNTHGFKTYGEYVAATQVSEHLQISITDLQDAMNAEGGNLGKAIHTLRPDMSSSEVNAELKRAEAAAKKAEAEAKKNKS